MHDTPAIQLPPETIAALITTALRARQGGDAATARTLLRALAARQPDAARIWLALATVAETRDEQRHALERVVALDPQHPLAQRGLARFREPPAVADARTARAVRVVHAPPLRNDVAAPPVAAPSLPPSVTLAPPDEAAPAAPEHEIRWPRYAVLAVAALVVVLALLLLRPWERPRADDTGSDPAALPLAAIVAAPRPAVSSVPTEVRQPLGALPEQPTDAPPPTDVAPPTSAAPPSANAPVASPAPPLLPGAIITYGDWHASLLAPAHAVLLDGSIGAAQPRGRFVLALVTLGNASSAPARIPPALFTLVDERGNRYQPQAALSTTYLATYGRGQRGDLSMEDAIPGGGGNVSVPLIFDVPTSARALTLLVGTLPQGWRIGAS